MKVIAYPKYMIEDRNITADALISICSPSETVNFHPEDFNNKTLVLKFDDIPAPEWTNPDGHVFYGPTSDHIDQAINFAKTLNEDDFLAIHCTQGKSRSAAIALIILCQEYGAYKAVRLLLENDKEEKYCFNPSIIRMYDTKYNGLLELALERECRPFVTWKKYWINKGVID